MLIIPDIIDPTHVLWNAAEAATETWAPAHCSDFVVRKTTEGLLKVKDASSGRYELYEKCSSSQPPMWLAMVY